MSDRSVEGKRGLCSLSGEFIKQVVGDVGPHVFTHLGHNPVWLRRVTGHPNVLCDSNRGFI